MKIDIIGQGNVGTHLADALDEYADVCRVNSRTLQELRSGSDVYFICVKDDCIRDVAANVCKRIKSAPLLLHCSGSQPFSILSEFSEKTGVFYPLQTFSKEREIDFKEVPVFIEGSTEKIEDTLADIAETLGCQYRRLNSSDRKNLHIGSIFACNFVNHLWTLADEFLKAKNIPFEVLHPLINETVKKLATLSPQDAQTGPAKRNDREVIESHLQNLSALPDLQSIYQTLTESIIKHYN